MNAPVVPAVPETAALALKRRYEQVRARSLALAAPLSAEDQAAQSMPDASPTKWHLAHTSWFFETFLLEGRLGYGLFDPAYGFLFNSYYETVGPRQPRPQRGLLTRPGAAEVVRYRTHVDRGMAEFLSGEVTPAEAALVELGLAHEEQHQELLLTDVLHLFAQNPLRPAYDPAWRAPGPAAEKDGFVAFGGGVVEIGSDGTSFAFDNEGPRHQALVPPFEIAARLTTNAEWLAFIEDGGYRRPELWLSDGWATVQAEGWAAPGYWELRDGAWMSLGLAGLAPVDPAAPVLHVSFYEADAFARWADARLPTEAEWEHAAESAGEGGLAQLYDWAWQWTASPYVAYPGFRPPEGAVGEYNGKFMVNQMVLRGGSLATSEGHARATYRNFFHPDRRWQFTGLRLARDAQRTSASASDPATDSFRRDVEAGLSAPRKRLSSKYLYDAAGSALFEDICDLPEYYPTRTEAALLGPVAREMAEMVGPGAVLIEFGSGSSTKTELVLDALPQVGVYAAIDISASALDEAAERLRSRRPDLAVLPVVGDFTRPLPLPAGAGEGMRVGFFPGSTIGNFAPEEAAGFLAASRAMLGEGSLFLVGVDLVKEPQVLIAAYDDAAGVTAAFNLNLLRRINRELGADFDLSAFAHRAVWNAGDSRMEMHLVSQKAQTVRVGARQFAFAKGETIHTENSYKYEPEVFARLAESSGWRVERHWIAPPPSFALFLLRS